MKANRIREARRWRSVLVRWSGQPWSWWQGQSQAFFKASILTLLLFFLLIGVAAGVAGLVSNFIVDIQPARAIIDFWKMGSWPIGVGLVWQAWVYHLDQEELDNTSLGMLMLSPAVYAWLWRDVFSLQNLSDPLSLFVIMGTGGTCLLLCWPRVSALLPDQLWKQIPAVHNGNLEVLGHLHYNRFRKKGGDHLQKLLEEEKLEELAEALSQLSVQEARQLEKAFLRKLLGQPSPYLRRVALRVLARQVQKPGATESHESTRPGAV